LILTESSGEILCSGNENVGGTGNWHGEVVREPVNGIGDADGIGGWNPDLIAAVMIVAWANVETAGRVHGKGFSAFSSFVGVKFDAGWSQWGLVEIEGAMNLGMGGQLGVDTGRTK
jgi:hypothetical protein